MNGADLAVGTSPVTGDVGCSVTVEDELEATLENVVTSDDDRGVCVCLPARFCRTSSPEEVVSLV